MSFDDAKKLSRRVNTVVLGLVIVLMFFFAVCRATILVYFSIPTVAVYLFNYILIKKGKLAFFIKLVYFWIVMYMELTTICLGYNFGFHLYAMSLIPIIFCSEYMGYKLGTGSIRPMSTSILIAVIYVLGTVITFKNGAIYKLGEGLATASLVFNAVVVFIFLISYTMILLRMVVRSEDELKRIAHLDKLTGLYNRHFIMDRLNSIIDEASTDSWLAMIDIDNFKMINDEAGHNSGDYVLSHVAEILSEACEGCVISRWGGEEFIVLAEGNDISPSVVEKARSQMAMEPFIYNDKQIVVTITAGVSTYAEGTSVDTWIKTADDKMYEGKKTTKNTVVY